MGRFIKKFANNAYIEFDRGGFDNYCVYYKAVNKERVSPKDTQYFYTMQQLAQKYGNEKVYKDFVEIYNLVEKELDSVVLQKISDMSNTYGSDANTVDVIYSVLYAGMIAEENKRNTKLGKRIKRYGIHMLLWEGVSVDTAANIMRGKSWKEIDKQCLERGF